MSNDARDETVAATVTPSTTKPSAAKTRKRKSTGGANNPTNPLLVGRKNAILEGLLIETHDQATVARRDIRQSPVVRDYLPYAVNILRRSEGFDDVVFLARDAIPLHRACVMMAGAWGVQLRAKLLELSGPMLKSAVGSQLESLRTQGTYENLSSRAVALADAGASVHGTTLDEYLKQELACLGPRVLVVDTGFWGTIPMFLRGYLSGRVVEYMTYCGPKGSPSMVTDRSANNWTLLAERTFCYPYRLSRVACRRDGSFYARRASEKWKTEKSAAQLAEFDEMVREYISSNRWDRPEA